MKRNLSKFTLALSSLLLIAGTMPQFAASEADSKTAYTAAEADFKAAYAAAESANKEAAALRNQWTTTVAALAAAKKVAESGDFRQALASAKEAEALARASIFQANSEKEAWKDLQIR